MTARGLLLEMARHGSARRVVSRTHRTEFVAAPNLITEEKPKPHQACAREKLSLNLRPLTPERAGCPECYTLRAARSLAQTLPQAFRPSCSRRNACGGRN